MSIYLVVNTPTKEVFDSYYYGYGEIVSQDIIHGNTGQVVFTSIDYGDDRWHANYQANRFASGLYFAEVRET